VLQRLLDEVIAEKGHTRYWLALRTGISQQNLGRIARGETTGIEFDLLERICEALECQPGDLLKHIKDEKGGKKKA
jgi:putative transcriptional regulator